MVAGQQGREKKFKVAIRVMNESSYLFLFLFIQPIRTKSIFVNLSDHEHRH